MSQTLRGKIIRGYQILDTIGAGGFGVVYKARQPIIERDVAIKVIHARYANQLEFTRRFELEARLVARLESQYIVPVYDYWRDPSGAYLVMRWLRGDNLRKVLMRHDALPINFVLKVMFQMVMALDSAHQNGVIHRDIKPENILFDESQNLYLSDFGIAIDLLNTPTEITMKTLSLGSPVYMAPEQLMRQETSPRADVYSLGIVLYEMLTGKNPFPASTTEIIRVKNTPNAAPIPSVYAQRPDLSPELDDVIWRATDASPAERYPRVTHFLNDLVQVLKTQIDLSLFQPLPLSEKPPVQSVEGNEMSTLPVNQGTVILPKRPSVGLLQDHNRDNTRQFDMHTVRNPFKGLRPFDEIDAADFFGRAEASKHLCDFFAERLHRFLAVIGASGSGKSSLVRAGLFSVLRQQLLLHSDKWLITSMTPGADPFQTLAETLTQIAFKLNPSLEDDLRASPQGFHEQLCDLLPEDIDLFLLIDQFEELFTLSNDEEARQVFLKALHYAITHPESRLRLVLTLRADYYDRPLQYPDFGALVREHTEVVLPLSDLALEEVIVEPALAVGLTVEQDLKVAILQDLSGRPGTLPLLQYTLSELYETRTNHNSLTLKAYEELGGISGALSRRAEAIFGELTPHEQIIAQRTFLLGIAVEGDGEPTRKRFLLADMLANLPTAEREQISRVVEHFAQYRLLTLDRDPATRSPTIEIAHEALIAAWGRLHGWISDNRHYLRLYDQLRMLTQAWVDAGHDSSFLVTGARLTEFESLLHTPLVVLSDHERAFILDCTKARERHAQRRRLVVIGLVIFSIFASALAIFALDQRQQALVAQASALVERDRANTEALTARSRELAANALANINRPDVALLLGYHATRTANTFEARNSLLTVLQSVPNVQAYLHGHDAVVRAVVYSADGTWAASAGDDLSVIVWDTETWQVRHVIDTPHSAPVNALAVHGDVLFSAGGDGVVHRWDALSGQPVGEPFTAHMHPVLGITINPNPATGGIVATGADDGTILIWSAATGEILHTLRSAHEGAVYAVEFSPNGTLIASGGADNRVRFWSTETGELQGSDQTIHTNWVTALAFSPSGRQLASSGADSQLVIWNASDYSASHTFILPDELWVRGIAYSASGEFLALAGLDGSVRRWDVISREMMGQPLRVHQNSVWDVISAPEADTFLTAGADGVLIAWNFTPPYRPAGRAWVIGQEALTMALHPVQDQIAVAVSNGQIQRWDMNQNRLLPPPGNAQSATTSLAFSPSGEWLAMWNIDNTLRVWSTLTDEQIGEVSIPAASLASPIRFSADSSALWLAGQGVLFRLDMADLTGTPEQITVPLTDITTFQFNADGSLLAVGGSMGEIALLDLTDLTTESVLLPRGHTRAVTALTFAQNRPLLASASHDATLILWDTITGQALFEPLEGHTDWVMDVALSPSARLMASASRDQTVMLWDIETARPLGLPLTGHRHWALSVVFHPDETRLYSLGREGVVLEWHVALADWQRRACEITNRDFRADEWARYFTEAPPACD